MNQRTGKNSTDDAIRIEFKGKSVLLVNTLTGKTRQFVSENGDVLINDQEIDYDAIHRELKHTLCADKKISKYHFGLYSNFKDGLCALSWTIYPDGMYFADESGFGGEDNDKEKVYCIIDTAFDIIIPFRPMKDVKEELRRTAEKRKEQQP